MQRRYDGHEARAKIAPRARALGLALCACAVAALIAWLPDGLSLRGAVAVRTLPAEVNLAHELRASLHAVARTWIAEHPPQQLKWDWGEGVLAFGFERAFQLTGDRALRDYLRTYLRHHLAQGVRVSWSDDATPALAALERVQAGDTELRPLVIRVVEYAMHAPRNASGMLLHLGGTKIPLLGSQLPEVWVDSLFHLVPTLMRYSRFTGDPAYRDAALRQLGLFVTALQDPSTGLVTHGYDERPRPERTPPFAARAFWARGNGWMLVTLIDTLAQLAPSDPRRPQLLASARRLAHELRRVQAASGLFHTLLLRPSSYQECAGSALILYALAQGSRLGLLDALTRQAVAQAGRGLLGLVRIDGRRAVVTGTSLGTNPIASLYEWTPSADQISYGVGAWLMAASEIAPLLDHDHPPP